MQCKAPIGPPRFLCSTVQGEAVSELHVEVGEYGITKTCTPDLGPQVVDVSGLLAPQSPDSVGTGGRGEGSDLGLSTGRSEGFGPRDQYEVCLQ